MKITGKIAAFLFLLMVSILVMVSCAGANGTGISGAAVNSNGHLILTLTNGNTIDAGNVVGPPGTAGNNGVSFTGVSVTDAVI